MSDELQFDEDPRVLYSRVQSSSNVPKMAGWFVKSGIAKDGRRATHILVFIALVAIVLAIIYPIIFNDEVKIEESTLPPQGE